MYIYIFILYILYICIYVHIYIYKPLYLAWHAIVFLVILILLEQLEKFREASNMVRL